MRSRLILGQWRVPVVVRGASYVRERACRVLWMGRGCRNFDRILVVPVYKLHL